MGDFVIEIIKELLFFFLNEQLLNTRSLQRISVMPQAQTKPLQN